jgi:hypothetical protein
MHVFDTPATTVAPEPRVSLPPPRGRPRRERVFVFVVKAPDLKRVIMDAFFDGFIGGQHVEDLIREYGLEDE